MGIETFDPGKPPGQQVITAKPLLEVAPGRSIMSFILDDLQNHGIGRIAVNGSYAIDKVEAYLTSRHEPNIQLFREITPLETGGGIYNALAQPYFTDEAIFIFAGDVILENDPPPAKTYLQQMQEGWEACRDWADCMLLLKPLPPLSAMTPTEGNKDYDIINDRPVLSSNKTGAYFWPSARVLKRTAYLDYHHQIVLNDPAILDKSKYSFLHYLKWAEANGKLAAIPYTGNVHDLTDPQDLDMVWRHYNGTSRARPRMP